MDTLVCKDESYAIIGACMKVHNALGQGFMESVYGDALEHEFKKRGIPYEREPQYQVTYDGEVLKHIFQPHRLSIWTVWKSESIWKRLATRSILRGTNTYLPAIRTITGNDCMTPTMR